MFPNERLCHVLIGTRRNFRWCGLVAEHPHEQDGERVLVCHFHDSYGRRLPFTRDDLPFYNRNGDLVVRRS